MDIAPAVIVVLLLFSLFLIAKFFLPGLRGKSNRSEKFIKNSISRDAAGMDGEEKLEMLENARDMARDHPDKTARLLRKWLQDDRP